MHSFTKEEFVMYTIVVCDSSQKNLNTLTSAVQHYTNACPQYPVTVYSFYSGFELNSFLEKGQNADIYFINMSLPTPEDGISLGRTIHLLNPHALIVYISDSTRYLLRGFLAHPFAYLVTPLSGIEIRAVLDDAFRQITPTRSSSVSMKTKNGLEIFDRSLLISIEYKNHQLLAHVHNRPYIKSITIRISFRNWIAPLLEYDCFISPHKSFLVNMDYVDSLTTSHTFIMRTGQSIPIAIQSFQEVKKIYTAYKSRPCSVITGD